MANLVRQYLCISVLKSNKTTYWRIICSSIVEKIAAQIQHKLPTLELAESAMTKHDLSLYFHLHCRFRLRSGKEVFGVLWEHEFDHNKLYFASQREHNAYRQALKLQQLDRAHRLALEINPDEIIGVESL